MLLFMSLQLAQIHRTTFRSNSRMLSTKRKELCLRGQ